MSTRTAATPVAAVAPEASTERSASLIDSQSVIDGTLSTSEDLFVEGRVLGTINCAGTQHVAEGAEVDATVDAGGIVVAGTLSGTVRCSGRMEIRPTGIVRARVETERLLVLEGAVYEGQLRMTAPEPQEEVEVAEPAEEPVAEPEAQSAAPATPPPAGSYSFLRNFGNNQPASEPGDDLPGNDPDEESS